MDAKEARLDRQLGSGRMEYILHCRAMRAGNARFVKALWREIEQIKTRQSGRVIIGGGNARTR